MALNHMYHGKVYTLNPHHISVINCKNAIFSCMGEDLSVEYDIIRVRSSNDYAYV